MFKQYTYANYSLEFIQRMHGALVVIQNHFSNANASAVHSHIKSAKLLLRHLHCILNVGFACYLLKIIITLFLVANHSLTSAHAFTLLNINKKHNIP